jgi:signal transduction histidine kinase/CheY-like chemotaxis protein
MARNLLLPALLLPFLIGWLRTVGEQSGLIDSSLGRPMMIVLLTVILVGLIFRNARHMSALEERRIAAEREKAEELARNTEAIEKARAAAVAARELAEQASRAKSDFLAALSHEMRTPLSPVMLTLADMAKHPEFPAALKNDLELVRHNLQLETRLISDLLDLTRIERQKMVLEQVDVDLHRVLRDTVAVCAASGGAAVSLDLQARRHWVHGDDTRLRQVFWNLLDNARKFTPASGRITIASDEPNPGHIRVRFTDTGCGIPAELTPRLFQAFEQGPARNSGQQRGLGLGLSIARKLIEAHRGKIAAASAGEGLGSTFMVELPALASSPASAVDRSVDPVETPTQRILLVEDHPSTLAVMKKLLEKIGHRVSTASTVADAVHLAETQTFDVLLSDLGLPDGSGLDIVRRTGLRFQGRAIALSGYGSEADVRTSHEQGFAMHLTKPVDMNAVQKALHQVAKGPAPLTPSKI